MPVDYSKWDHIDVSDDEDDTHPNVDTPSLFRWRHKARVEKEDLLRKERFECDREGDKLRRQLAKIQNRVADRQATVAELNTHHETIDDWNKKEQDLARREKEQPWNVDSLSKEKEERTLINKPRPEYVHYDDMSEDDKSEYFERYSKLPGMIDRVKTYGMTPTAKGSYEYLRKEPDLACDFTTSWLTVWCIDLAQEGKLDLSDIVAHQLISMKFILELSKSTKRHPADCFPAFYAKRVKHDQELAMGSQLTEDAQQHHDAFNDEFNSFKDRVKQRVIARNKEAAEKKASEADRQRQKDEYRAATGKELADDEELVEISKEDRQSQTPGGLDPIEVLNSLPDDLKECFETQNVEKLQELINTKFGLYAEDMRRCVLSGLWVPTKDSPLYKFIDPESGIDPNAPLECIEIEDENGEKVTQITSRVEKLDTDGDSSQPDKNEPVEIDPVTLAAAGSSMAASFIQPVPSTTSLDEVD